MSVSLFFQEESCLLNRIMKKVAMIAMHGFYSIDFLSLELVWLLMAVLQQRPTLSP